jgi:PAS domain S-box-containing protein
MAKILIVEDESIEALDLKNTLQIMDHEVIGIASRGEDAIKIVHESDVDLILMDIILKGHMDGIKAAERIKKLNIPVVYLTAHSEDTTVNRALDTNPYGYLLKPFDIIELKFTIKLALNKHEMEKKLQESEKLFRTMVETAQEGVWAMDKNYRTSFVNQKMADMLGYQPSDMIGKPVNFFMFDEDLKDHNIRMKSRQKGISESYERRFRHKDGKAIWTIVSATSLITENDLFNGSFAMFTNITGRKKTEKLLKRSENKYREIFENSMEGIYQSTPEGKLVTVNPAFAKMFGYDSPEEMISSVKDIQNQLYVNPEDRDYMASLIEENGSIKNYEIEFNRYQGNTIWTLINAKGVRDQKGNMIMYEGTIIDITDRKKAEMALYEKQIELTEISANIPDIIARFDKNLRYTYVSPSVKLYMRLNQDDFIGYTNEEIGMPYNNLKVYNQALKDVFKSGKPKDINISFSAAGGDRYYESRLIPEFSEEGIIKSVLAINRDITEQKMYQDKVLESQILFETIARVTPVGLFQTDPYGKYIYVNQRWCDIANLTFESAMDEGWLDAVHPNDKDMVSKEWFTTIDNKRFKLEYRFLDIDNKSIWVLGEALPEVDNDGNILGYVGTVTDITDLKYSEEEIRRQLEEKDILLREVHHRVKNNLQIISSLINLQVGCVEGDETIEILKESQNRVRTMAMVHENLYLSDSLNNINMAEYINKLVKHLFYSYGVQGLEYKIEVDDLELNIDTAIPCGLIINELVTNSIKHAYPESEGIITIKLRSSNQKFILIISDQGVGLPSDFDLEKTTTLGLKLVNSLVKQLDGKLEIEVDTGTDITIIFRELVYGNNR